MILRTFCPFSYFYMLNICVCLKGGSSSVTFIKKKIATAAMENALRNFGVLQGKLTLRRSRSIFIVCNFSGKGLTFIQTAFNLMNQDISWPTVFGGLLDAPHTLIGIFYLVQNDGIMWPRNLCRHRLHKFFIRISLLEFWERLLSHFRLERNEDK